MMDRMMSVAPEVACLTEAFEDSTRALGGYAIAERGARWSIKRHEDERLVVLWSETPWRDVAPAAPGTEGGACLVATTDTPLGSIRVVGVCAPHHAASPVGRAARAPMWSEQISFWRGLGGVLEGQDSVLPLVVLGDFNQYLPRIWGSKTASAAMLSALGRLHIVTEGIVPGIGEPTIDHLACTDDLALEQIEGLSRFADDGSALSDHFGLAVRLSTTRLRFGQNIEIAK